jgi:hypothetical protein
MVQFSIDEEPVIMTEREKLHAKSLGYSFFDVYVLVVRHSY